MRTEIISMTPEAAEAILAKHNIGNRALRENHVQKFVGIIHRNEWVPLSQGVSLSSTGRLLNGQHRLAAIAKAGKTVLINMTYDEPDANYAVLDSDLVPRRAMDYLQVPTRVAEVSKLITAVCHPSSHDRTVETTKAVHAIFGDAAQQVVDTCPTYKRAVTSAPVRTAAAIRVALGQGAYVLPLFKKIANVELDDLPPIAKAFIKQTMDENRITPNNRGDYLVRAWTVFDEAKKDLTKLSVRGKSVIMAEIRAAVKEQMDINAPPPSTLIKKTSANGTA